MQYIKHYYVNDNNGIFCCESPDPTYKRHPWKEYTGLDVKIWLSDPDGIDVCLSELPDSTSVSTVLDQHSNKNSIQVLTQNEYNTVSVPYFEAQTLFQEAFEARQQGDHATAETKETSATTKLSEAMTALHAL